MKKILTILGLALLGLMMVSCYDDSALWNSMQDYENRLVSLEAKYDALNGEVSSLKTLVSAVQQGDYITSVAPITEGGKEVGYTITFAKNGSITIKHGTAVSGTTPVIGVKKDTDGVYYWTVNGEWLLDETGKKVKAGAVDGNDGVTPKLKIENEYWYVSYDDGKTWTPLDCKATGEDGAPGKTESIFKAVYPKDGYLVVELADGNVFNIPMNAEETLSIQLNVESDVAIVPGTTLKVKYVVKGGDDHTLVRTIINEDWVYAAVKPETASEGYIYLYLEEWFDGVDDEDRDELIDEEDFGPDVTEGDFYHSMISVFITVTDGRGNQVIKVLNVNEGQLDSVLDAFITDAVAGTVTAQVKTNVDYEVVIPEKDSWLSYSPVTKAQVRTDELTFNVTANTENMFRSSQVRLVNNMNQTLESFVVLQRSPIAGEKMTFKDKTVENACVSAFDTNFDGVLTYEEAALVTDLGKFRVPQDAMRFDELKHFVGIKSIPSKMFAGCNALRSVTLPEQIASIGAGAFYDCRSLQSLTIPQGVTSIGRNENDDYYYESYGVFENCISLREIVIPSGVKYLNASALFANCYNLQSVTLPEIEYLGYRMFENCMMLTKFDIPASVESFESNVFIGSGLTEFVLPSKFDHVPDAVCANCQSLTKVVLHEGVKSIGSSAFEYCSALEDFVLPANLKNIGYGAFRGSGIRGSEVEIEGRTLNALQIPESIEHIESYAFSECQNLKAIQFVSTTPCSVSYGAFSKNTVLYVPAGYYYVYRNTFYEAYNWAEKNVTVYGDYNGWDFYGATQMTKGQDGWYSCEVSMAQPGSFAFVADWNWDLMFRLSYEYNTNEVYEGVEYNVSGDSGIEFYIPAPGLYMFYISEDMSKFYYVSNGDAPGTESNPHLISTASDMMSINERMMSGQVTYFKLAADIDMSEVYEWIQINTSPYDAQIFFDGNGHKITNYKGTAGLFKVLYGTFQNVVFENCEVEGTKNCGMLADYLGYIIYGNAYSAYVKNIAFKECRFQSSGNDTGLLCAYAYSSLAENVYMENCECSFGSRRHGFLAGRIESGTAEFKNCYVKGGKVLAGTQQIGGLIGQNNIATLLMSNCGFSAEFNGVNRNLGGILAYAKGPEGYTQIENCIVWSPSIMAVTQTGDLYSSGVVVGCSEENVVTYKNNYRRADISFADYTEGMGYLTDSPDVEWAKLETTTPDPWSFTHAFAYHGKAVDSGVTASQAAKQLGWDESVWDLSGDEPVLKM